MKQIWGKGSPIDANGYSVKSKVLIAENIAENSRAVVKEFLNNEETCHSKDLHQGSRFRSLEQIIRVLESNVKESDFLQEPDHYTQRVLLGALSADHWYQFEKKWD